MHTGLGVTNGQIGQRSRSRSVLRRATSVLAVGVLLGAATACGSDDGDGEGGERISFTAVTGTGIPDPIFAELWVGQELGWFDEAGIDLEVEVAQGALDATSALVGGAADLGVFYADPIPDMHMQGEEVQAIYQMFYSPVYDVVFPEGSEVSSLAEMEGQRLGVIGPGSTTVPFGRWALQQAGVDPDTVEFVPVGFGAEGAAAIAANRVEAAMWYFAWTPLIEDQGIDITVSPIEGLDGVFAGGMIAAMPDTLADRESDVTTFLQVYTRIREFCLSDAEGCIDAYIAGSEDETPRDVLLNALQVRNELSQLPPEANGLHGYTEASYWETMVDLLLDGGWIEESPPVEQMFSTDFIEAANEAPPNAEEG